MLANAVERRQQIGDEQMSWRAAAALWVGLATLGWLGIGALVSSLA